MVGELPLVPEGNRRTLSGIPPHSGEVMVHPRLPHSLTMPFFHPIPPGAPLKLDGRPGTCSQDTYAHCDQALLRELCNTARGAGTDLQPAVFEVAATSGWRAE